MYPQKKNNLKNKNNVQCTMYNVPTYIAPYNREEFPPGAHKNINVEKGLYKDINTCKLAIAISLICLASATFTTI